MGYRLGIDLGTTYTAAATVDDDGRAEIFQLGDRSAVVPTVVLLREDGEVLVGDAAARRAVTEPQRVAREFKRRLGDTTPYFLGGAPHSAESLMAKVLAWVRAQVVERQGTAPDRVALTRPANWGSFKVDLFKQAARMAELDDPLLVTEPEAAALHYATVERVEPGEVVAVYDLGGGTFDATVLRRTTHGFAILGAPEGIERLGGIDVDAAVLAHVQRSLGGALEGLDENDPATLGALARLRAECQEAKEALSSDTDAVVPVLLPTVATEVRITRDELEQMVRPALSDSVAALRRALRSAQVEPEQVGRVLLVGGSSRIPLVAQLVTGELGRPVAVDAHPKHGVALGAALAADGTAAESATEPTRMVPTITPEMLAGGAAGAAAGGLAGAALAGGDAAPAAGPPPATPPTPPATPPTAPATAPATPPGPPAAEPPVTPAAHQEPAVPPAPASTPPATEPVAVTPPPTGPPAGPAPGPPGDGAGGPTGPDDGGGRRSPALVVGLVVLVVAVAVGAVLGVLALTGDDGTDEVSAADTADSTTTSPADASSTTDDITPSSDASTTTTTGAAIPPACAGATGDFICITEAEWQGDTLVVTYDTELDLTLFPDPDDLPVDSNHAHFFFDTVPLSQAGTPGGGPWVIWDQQPVFDAFTRADVPDGATAVCVLVANFDHSVQSDTGNCIPIPA